MSAIGPLQGQERLNKASQIRISAAREQAIEPIVAHPCNSDELLMSKAGNYSKGLPHNPLGEVDPSAYTALIKALSSGNPHDYESIPLGGGQVKLTNPQNAMAYSLEGQDSHNYSIPAAFSLASEKEAAEMAELYWMALTRDVPFSDYPSHPLTLQAVDDLRRFSLFTDITPQTLFRAPAHGNSDGLYVTQFLLKDLPYGAKKVQQSIEYPEANFDYLTDYEEWLSIQRGLEPQVKENKFIPVVPGDDGTRFLYNGRGIGQWVHLDWPYQATLNAALILLSFGNDAIDGNNPYMISTTQKGFNTFGGPHILNLISKAADLALKAAWYQKWQVHRRLRPEVFSGRVHNQRRGLANYSIDSRLIDSPVLPLIFEHNRSQNLNRLHKDEGTYLQPQAFPEGSPTHPAYPAGHATFVAAGVTVLKAFFREDFIIPNPMKPIQDGKKLVPYQVGIDGPALTVGGELNKLAANVAIARNIAGVHWRSDGLEGNNLGEAVAISVLKDLRKIYNEDFTGFSLTKFDGSAVTI